MTAGANIVKAVVKMRVCRVLIPVRVLNESLCIYSSEYFANRNVQCCIFMSSMTAFNEPI